MLETPSDIHALPVRNTTTIAAPVASSSQTLQAGLGPVNGFLSLTFGRLSEYAHRDQVGLYKSPALAHTFLNPLLRRDLYRRAHADPHLARSVIAADALYPIHASLTKFEDTVNDIIVVGSIPLCTVLEATLGNALDAIERDAYEGQRTRVGRAFDAIKYALLDPFHAKRQLYTLTVT